MTSKERVLNSLNHMATDKVAMDFGGTAVSGMHVTAIQELRKYYGLENSPVKVSEPYQMLGEIEEDLLTILGIDTLGMPAPNTMFGFKNENWKEFKAPWGQDLLVSEHFNTKEDGKGGLFMYPEGDMNVPPSALMPKSGYFFDTLIRQEPVDELHHLLLTVDQAIEARANVPHAGADGEPRCRGCRRRRGGWRNTRRRRRGQQRREQRRKHGGQ